MKRIKLFENFLNEAEMTFDELQSKFKKAGMEVTKPVGSPDRGNNGRMFVAMPPVDGMQYVADVYDFNNVKQFIDKYKRIQRHNDIIEKVYKYIESKYGKEIWIMSGGGAQLQAFYGNNTGYLATLYLDMEDPDDNDDLEAAGRGDGSTFTLTVNGSKNDKNFKDLHISKVEVLYSRDLYGRSDDDMEGLEEYYDADNVLKLLKKKYPKAKFIKQKYYDVAECVFLSTDHDGNLLNSWNRDSDSYDDGLVKEFAKFLKEHGLKWYWHSKESFSHWDGIEIIPTDYKGYEEYYKNKSGK